MGITCYTQALSARGMALEYVCQAVHDLRETAEQPADHYRIATIFCIYSQSKVKGAMNGLACVRGTDQSGAATPSNQQLSLLPPPTLTPNPTAGRPSKD